MNNVSLVARSSRIFVPRIRRQHTLVTAARSTRRNFFSFFDGSNSNSNSIRSNDAERLAATQKAKQEEEATRVLLDGVFYRMSIQHAHPLGPWQAIRGAVEDHYDHWLVDRTQEQEATQKKDNNTPVLDAKAIVPFRVLDLACGSRGEPGTTIAHALPLAAVHCTDSCSVAVAAIQLFVHTSDDGTTTAATDAAIGTKEHNNKPDTMSSVSRPPPPKNLTKSVTDLTDLSSYETNSFDALICCYGYGLSSDISHALQEANRVLVPGGVLVIATWERSAMLSIGRDVLASVRGGGRDPYAAEDDDEAFLPPRVSPPDTIELSGVGELEDLLAASGFNGGPRSVVSRMGVYPIDLGIKSEDQFAMGTILVRGELDRLGALTRRDAGDAAGGWGSLAEEAFWINIQKYTDVVDDGTMFLRDNAFKLTISTKSLVVASNNI
jgi:SAM-dependent methyltransferase